MQSVAQGPQPQAEHRSVLQSPAPAGTRCDACAPYGAAVSPHSAEYTLSWNERLPTGSMFRAHVHVCERGLGLMSEMLVRAPVLADLSIEREQRLEAERELLSAFERGAL